MKNDNFPSLYVLYNFFLMMTVRLKHVVNRKNRHCFYNLKKPVLTSLVFDTLCYKNTMTYCLLKLNKNRI